MSRDFMSVSEVTRRIKRIIDGDETLQNVWMRAEISNFNHHSRGHMYFTLKDDKSRINSVMFAGNNRFLKFTPENGMSVLVRGDISVYEPHGQYQLYVKEMQPDGIGNLYLAYENLKKKLEMAGFFSNEKKKTIPSMPKEIAVVTSPTGAAVRDIIITIKRRFPLVKVTLLPVLVQGPNAPVSIAKAINQANEANRFDVMIVGRGGGSLEELWAFNEQIVAEAIYESNVPIISAVGHETDITISDFVADLRAPTPTAAAEMAVPDMLELTNVIQNRKDRLVRAMDRKRSLQKERLSFFTKSYAFRYPRHLIEQKEQDLDRLVESMRKAVDRQFSKKQDKLEELHSRIQRVHPELKWKEEKSKLVHLDNLFRKTMKQAIQEKEMKYSMLLSKLSVLSPLKIMERGYSLVYDENNQLIKSVDGVKRDSDLTIRLQDGKLKCLVEETIKEKLPTVKSEGRK